MSRFLAGNWLSFARELVLNATQMGTRSLKDWKRGVRPMIRALKVFGEAAVDAIVNRELGMTMRQFITLGLAVNGNFVTNWGMSTNQDYSDLGISREASDAFSSGSLVL